jgi:hypothetical protein
MTSFLEDGLAGMGLRGLRVGSRPPGKESTANVFENHEHSRMANPS